jgi:hypothetical protein
MTETTATDAPKLSVPETLAKVEESFREIFETSEMGLPFVKKASGYDAPGTLTVKATADSGAVEITVGYNFDNAYPDYFEQAQRIIFASMLEQHVARISTVFGK